MSTFRRRAFVFVSSHTSPELGPVERGFVAVMAELVALGGIYAELYRIQAGTPAPAGAAGAAPAHG